MVIHILAIKNSCNCIQSIPSNTGISIILLRISIEESIPLTMMIRTILISSCLITSTGERIDLLLIARWTGVRIMRWTNMPKSCQSCCTCPLNSSSWHSACLVHKLVAQEHWLHDFGHVHPWQTKASVTMLMQVWNQIEKQVMTILIEYSPYGCRSLSFSQSREEPILEH